MNLSEKIYQCRKEAGLSQEALAEQIGVSRQSVSKWETGEADPEIAKLKLLSETFHVSVDWLLSEEDTPETPQLKTDGYNESLSCSSANSDSDLNNKNQSHSSTRNILHIIGWIISIVASLFGGYLVFAGIMMLLLVTQIVPKLFGTADMVMVGDQMHQISTFTSTFSPLPIAVIILGTIMLIGSIVFMFILAKKKKKQQ